MTRTYETPDGPDHLSWFWSMNVNGPMTHSGHMPTLEEARRNFRRAGMTGRRGRNWRSWSDF